MRLRVFVPVVVATFAVAACKGDKGDVGPQGPQGSAADGGSSGATSGTSTGLNYQIQSATVASGAAPTVTFKVTDASGNPVSLTNPDGTLAFTPSFTMAKRGADGGWSSLLTRSVAGKPWIDAAGTTHQPALPNATQAASEAAAAARLSGGSGGVYTYTFANPIASADAGATHRFGVYGNRTVSGVAYPASSTLDFVPSGGTPSGTDLVSDNQCSVCHGVVRAHGDQRLGVKLCLTCHTPQTTDPETGNTVDMPVMIHKIHMGKELARGYTIVGFAPNNPAVFPATSVLAFGDEVEMAPSHSTYFELTKAGTGPTGALPVSDPGIIRNCAICHGSQAATVNAPAAFSRAACVQCHDDVNFETGANHPRPTGGITVTSDTQCAGCHSPGGVDPAVRHGENYETTRKLLFTPTCTDTVTTNCHKLEIVITDVKNAIAGQNPQIEFTVKLDGQPYDVSTRPLSMLAFQFAGPLTQYGYPEVFPTTQAVAANPGATPPVAANIAVSPGVSNALVSNAANPMNIANMGTGPGKVEAIDAAGGKFRFTMPMVIPVGRTGTYAFSFEGMYKETKTGPNGELVSKPYAAAPVFNGANRNVQYRNVANGTAGTERASVALTAKCNNCHEDIGFHSNRERHGIDYCATCHDPNLDNRGRFRFQGPANTKVLVESVSANVYIHRIHMGAELPSVQAGGKYQLGAVRDSATATFAGPQAWNTANPTESAISDFTGFESPRPVQACDTCHAGKASDNTGTWVLPDANNVPLRRGLINCDTVKATAPDVGWCDTRSVAQETFTPPQQAVCSSCHDSPQAIAHFDLNTTYPAVGGTPVTRTRVAGDANHNAYSYTNYNPYQTGTSGALDPSKVAIEACDTCHGSGREFDPVRVHQPPTFLSGSR